MRFCDVVDLASKNFIADCWRGNVGDFSKSGFSTKIKIYLSLIRLCRFWLPMRSSKWSKEVRGRHRFGRSAFYIVLKGRKCGVFYKWEDCLASVANFDL